MITRKIMQAVLHLLYHPFAFTYDLIAAIVSLGRWKDWVLSVVPFIQGDHVLELGHGPGHLQGRLQDLNRAVVGLDESAWMTNLARKRLRRSGRGHINLVRAIAQNLPFPGGYFDTIVSTFPSEYIFHPVALAEVRRCLREGGRLVVLPVAWHTGKKLIERYAAWIFKVTGESPPLEDALFERIRTPFENAGFQVDMQKLEVESSLLLVLVAVDAR